MAQRDKIDRTIMRSMDMVEKLEKLFGNNGAFEQAVAEAGGDIGWFGDVRENLKTLYGNIEELHMGAVSHMDESKMSDQLIHDSETMSKEDFTKKYGKEVADEYFESVTEGKLKDEMIDDMEKMSKEEFAKKYGKESADDMYESAESLDYIKKLAGL